MGHTPKIGRRPAITEQEEAAQLEAEQRAADEQKRIEDLKPSAFERTLGSYDAIIKHRVAEKASLMTQRPSAAPLPEPVLVAVPGRRSAILERVAQMSAAEREQEGAARERRIEANRAVLRPLVDRVEAVKRAIKALRDTHLVAVTELASLDVATVIRRTAAVITPGSIITNHTRIAQLQQEAERAATSLKTDFLDLDRAVSLAELVVDYEQHTQAWRSAIAWLVRQLENMENNQRTVMKALLAIDKLEPLVHDDLIGAAAVEPEPKPEPIPMPSLGELPPSRSDSSYYDFDPRENYVPRPERDDVRVIGDNLGVHVGKPAQHGLAPKAKVIN